MTAILPHEGKFVFEESQVMSNNKIRVQFFSRKFVDLMIRKGTQTHSRRQKKAEMGKGGEGGRVGMRTGKLHKFPLLVRTGFRFLSFLLHPRKGV